MAYKILFKEEVGPGAYRMIIDAPHVAKNARPGQFIVLRVHDRGERIPLTISKADKEKGEITIIFQVVGKSTKHLSLLNEGDELADFLGPLGMPSEIETFGTVVLIGGGFGTAVLYPMVAAYKEAGNHVIVINGARNKDLLLLEKDLSHIADEYYVTTDDGSKGLKGFVTDMLKQLIDNGVKINRVFAVGPVIMMANIAKLTKEHKIKTIVSLNPIMVDGTGMCGACRVEVAGKTKFACVDGPDFDAHEVNFDLLMKRLRMYRQEEQLSLEKFEKEIAQNG